MATLREAIEAIEAIKVSPNFRKTSIADKLLGKFKGIIPPSKTSSQFIKELRESLYGKIQN